MTYLWYVPPAGTEDDLWAHKNCNPVCSYTLSDELHHALMGIFRSQKIDIEIETDDKTGETLAVIETPRDPKVVDFLPEWLSPAFILEQWAADPGELQFLAPEWLFREALPALAAAARREDPEAGDDAFAFYRWLSEVSC